MLNKFTGDLVLVPSDLLAALLEHGAFKADISKIENADAAVEYVLAFMELEKILEIEKREPRNED